VHVGEQSEKLKPCPQKQLPSVSTRLKHPMLPVHDPLVQPPDPHGIGLGFPGWQPVAAQACSGAPDAAAAAVELVIIGATQTAPPAATPPAISFRLLIPPVVVAVSPASSTWIPPCLSCLIFGSNEPDSAEQYDRRRKNRGPTHRKFVSARVSGGLGLRSLPRIALLILHPKGCGGTFQSRPATVLSRLQYGSEERRERLRGAIAAGLPPSRRPNLDHASSVPQLLTAYQSKRDEQVPLTQLYPGGQTMKHAPQWFASEARLTQVPLQLVWPLGQGTGDPVDAAAALVIIGATHTAPPAITLPAISFRLLIAPAVVVASSSAMGPPARSTAHWLGPTSECYVLSAK
jgi:hypothetical protein